MRNPARSQDSLKAFARRMIDRLARNGIAVDMPTMLEALASGYELGNWNALAAAMPKDDPAPVNKDHAAVDGPAMNASVARLQDAAAQGPESYFDTLADEAAVLAARRTGKKPVRLRLRDWRFASGGAEAARAELSEAQRMPWPVRVASPDGDSLSIEIIDPLYGFDDERCRSVWIGVELDKSVPKVLLARLGSDNLANVWMAGGHDALLVDTNCGGAIAIERGGWQSLGYNYRGHEALGDVDDENRSPPWRG